MTLLIKLSLALCLAVAVYSAATPRKAGKLIWEDNFDGLDEGRWRHLVTAWRGGNDEFQYYRNNRKNSWVEGGVLKIRPTPVNEERSDNDIRWGQISEPGCNMDPCVSQGGNGDIAQPIFSARMHTQGTFDFTYGRVEVRAKMPRGDWIWPAIWMMPAHDAYGGWPRSGEIDVVESRGNRDLHAGGNSVGVDAFGSTLHWAPDFSQDRWYLAHWERNLGDLSNDFHVFECEWNDWHMTFRVDGQEYGSIYPPDGGMYQLGGFGGENPWAGRNKMAPFDQPFYLIFNVAVGGRFFDDSFVNGGYPRPWNWGSGHPMQEFYESQGLWKPTWDRDTMEIDYVRVFEI